MRAEAAKLARAFLPRRRDPEPGSIELPAFLFAWLTNDEPDTFDLTDLGVLAALAYSFANQSGDLFVNGSFTVTDGVPTIVCRQSGAGVRLVRSIDDTQHVQVGVHLATLKRNKWIDTMRMRGTYTIQPGERMRKLWPMK